MCLLYVTETVAIATWNALYRVTQPPTEQQLHTLIGSVYNGVVLDYCLHDSETTVHHPEECMELSDLICDQQGVSIRIKTMHRKYAWAVHAYMEYIVPRMLVALKQQQHGTTKKLTESSSVAPPMDFMALRPYHYFANKHAVARSLYMSRWGKQEHEAYNKPLEFTHKGGNIAAKAEAKRRENLKVHGFLACLHDAVIGSKHRYLRSVGLPWQLLPIVSPAMQTHIRMAAQQADLLEQICLANCFVFGNKRVETRNVTDGSVPGVESQ